MASINKKTNTSSHTHGGAKSVNVSVKEELNRTVLTCMLWEDSFYENGESTADRIKTLVAKCDNEYVSDLAIKARNDMHLRHVPLLLVREMARKGGKIVSETLVEVIQRPDEITEFLAIYWKDGKCPLSSQVKKGLAKAFTKFNEYQLAKYNRDTDIKLRDALFMCHAKPLDNNQAEVWRKLVDGTITVPDTWEVALSSGLDKKETFERLLEEGKLGGLAVLRNLRNMINANVDLDLIRDRLKQGLNKALPFRFMTAARYAPALKNEISEAMLSSLAQYEKLPGKTLLVVDTSGSMMARLSVKSELTRFDVASALAVLVREVCEDSTIYATAGNDYRRAHATTTVPNSVGLQLADDIVNMKNKIGYGGIFLKQCMDFIADNESNTFDRVIVLTDEQDCDTKCNPASAKKLGKNNYIINIVTYKNGIGYNSGWTHINGWSERVIDYIYEYEQNLNYMMM